MSIAAVNSDFKCALCGHTFLCLLQTNQPTNKQTNKTKQPPQKKTQTNKANKKEQNNNNNKKLPRTQTKNVDQFCSGRSNLCSDKTAWEGWIRRKQTTSDYTTILNEMSTILLLRYIGHWYVTPSFLLKGEKRPVCIHCDTILFSLKHDFVIVWHYVDLAEIRERYFETCCRRTVVQEYLCGGYFCITKAGINKQWS